MTMNHFVANCYKNTKNNMINKKQLKAQNLVKILLIKNNVLRNSL